MDDSVESKWTHINAASETLFCQSEAQGIGLMITMWRHRPYWIICTPLTSLGSMTRITLPREQLTGGQNRAQARLREMKDKWWSDNAIELQTAADRHDSLMAIYGPQDVLSAPVTRDITGWTTHNRSHQSPRTMG